MYFFSVANPNPLNWLSGLATPYKDVVQQEALLKLLNELAMIFMRSALESLNKSYDLFMMLEQVDKQIAVIEKEQQFKLWKMAISIMKQSYNTNLKNISSKR